MTVIFKVARHAGHGRFVNKAYAHRYPWLTVVETIRVRRPSRKRARR
jgi:hypothetical protein